MCARVASIATLLAAAVPAVAGPPYATDDPEPTDRGTWEIYGYAAGEHMSGETSGDAGLDVNFGAAKDLQLTLVLPADWDARDKGHLAAGAVEIGAKYRIVHQSAGTFWPDIAIFPAIELPTATQADDRHTSLALPVWAQKDVGRWSVFAGGGYTLNFGKDRRNSWMVGIATTYAVAEHTRLGLEAFRATSDARGEKATFLVEPGFTQDVSAHWAVLGAAGPSWTGRHRGVSAYLGLLFHG